MLKLKPLSELICPECGKNEPVFFIDFELRAFPIAPIKINDNTDYYDLELENDFGYMASTMDDAICDGHARCECALCGTSIDYYYEEEGNET